MSITEKEPVVEQPSDDIKIEDSEESASESPTTSSSYVEKNNQNNHKVDIDYLDSNLFSEIKKDLKNENIYHHCGVYIFTKDALTRYVSLSRSKLEIDRNLEQMRAMENNMVIKVGLIEDVPLSVDTEEDLKKIAKEIGKQ